MKKSTFVNLLLGTVGGLLFAIGMCMCLLPEWNAFTPGLVVTAVGGILLLALGVVSWVRSGKQLHCNWKLLGKIAYGTLSSLVLGLGMCLIMVWQQMLWGILVGVAGIVMLLFLLPMCVGFRK